MVTENLKKVEEKIEKACERSGRSRSDVTLIAVSKTKPIEMMQEAMQAGVSIFGENKVQEIVKCCQRRVKIWIDAGRDRRSNP